jgi:hypothetical protein
MKMSAQLAAHLIGQNLTGGQQTVAAGGTAVLDVRGAKGFVVHLIGTGTATYQPCDKDGAVVPGSASTAVTTGALVEAAWSHYLVSAATAAAEACVV